MKHYSEFNYHFADLQGTRKKIDNTIYTFDIETTSYFILNDKICNSLDYEKLTEDEKEDCIPMSTMYVWQFSINEQVFYGRTWKELKLFLDKLEYYNPNKKILFIHNASFEFQFLKSEFEFIDVLARKSHKVMKATFKDYNMEIRCSYLISNAKLEELPKLYKLPVKKLIGNLDYNLLRHSNTKLTDEELEYCENDCLVVYEYIKLELETYKRVDKIPITSTGHVRRELKAIIDKDYKYKNKVKNIVNTEPHIYNMLINAFMGRLYTRKLVIYR